MSSRIATPVLLFLTAIAVRILSWHSVFQQGAVYPNGNDAYYHFRRIRYSIEHFPSALEFDPLINFPAGAQPIWPPTFDWLIAAMLRLLPSIEEPGQLERYAVWIPPILGAATIVFVYFVAMHFFSRAVAIMAAVAMAILPAHSIYSRLGAVDHHVLVASAVAVMLFAAMALFREGWFREDSRREDGVPPPDGLRLGPSVGLGVSIAAAVLVWPGSLLQVGVLQLGMVVRLVTASESRAAERWALRFAVVHLVACLAVAPMSAGQVWQRWGALSPVVLSNFQPLYFLAASLCFGLLGVMWRRGWGASTRVTRLVSAAALGAVLLAGLMLAIPDLRGAILEAWSWFTKEEEFQSVVNESAPLFGGRAGSLRARAFLGGFVYFVPPAIVYLGWRFRERAEVLLLLGWAAALFGATLVQWRFMNSYSIAHGLLIGLTLESVYQTMRPRLMTRPRVWGAAGLGLAVVLVAFQPALKSYRLHLENVGRSWRGEPTLPVGILVQSRFVVDAARFLRDHSPSPDDAPYSVLGPWGDGHILKYVAERAIVQDNFGDDVAPENFRRAEDYFAARSESDALDIVSPLATRYVLVRATGSGHSQGYESDSLFDRLYQLRGAGGRPMSRPGRRASSVDSLRRHRLVYQSRPLDQRDPKAFCMVFEIVAGAELVGRAMPGERIRAALEIEPRVGRDFAYTAEVEADSDGVYRIRLPYSNEPFSPDVRTGDHYTLRAGDRSLTVVVPESAVQSGARIEVPAFGN